MTISTQRPGEKKKKTERTERVQYSSIPFLLTYIQAFNSRLDGIIARNTNRKSNLET